MSQPTVLDPFAPARLGPITLRNRTIKSATFEGMTPEGLVTDELVEFHRSFARGGIGMTTVAYLAASPEGRTQKEQIWLRPEADEGLRRLTDAVHAEGAAISAQLGHAGPVSDARSTGARALAPSAEPSMLSFEMIHACTEEQIARITEDYANGAKRIVDAGFDCIEIHLGHNYLLSAFLSPAFNRRKDRYGGSLENRARFPLEVVRRVREAAGGKAAVIAKVNMTDGVRRGLEVEESIEFAKMLEAQGALDALELTAGSSPRNPMFLFRGEVPVKEFAANFPFVQRIGLRLVGKAFLREYPYEEAYLLPTARRFREALKMPLVLLGGITERATLDQAMREGFEFVAMARGLLREPDLVKRMQSEPTHKSLCTHCNRCMPTIYTGTRCVLNDPPPAG